MSLPPDLSKGHPANYRPDHGPVLFKLAGIAALFLLSASALVYGLFF